MYFHFSSNKAQLVVALLAAGSMRKPAGSALAESGWVPSCWAFRALGIWSETFERSGVSRQASPKLKDPPGGYLGRRNLRK